MKAVKPTVTSPGDIVRKLTEITKKDHSEMKVLKLVLDPKAVPDKSVSTKEFG